MALQGTVHGERSDEELFLPGPGRRLPARISLSEKEASEGHFPLPSSFSTPRFPQSRPSGAQNRRRNTAVRLQRPKPQQAAGHPNPWVLACTTLTDF